VQAVRHSCSARVDRIGIAGVSGGGLDAIRAFTLDREGTLDAGVIAISPLLDVPVAVRDLSETGSCIATRAVELNWFDDLTIAAASGAAFFGGAALVQALGGQSLDANTVIAGGIGAGAGLLTALTVDAWFDGGTSPCVSQNAIAYIVQGALQIRWRALRERYEYSLSPAGRRLDPAAITLDDYVRERARFGAERIGLRWRELDPRTLATDLRAALATDARSDARLVVIGAEDDPMTRVAGLHDFSRRTMNMPQVYARAVTQGGHGALSIVQPTIVRAVFEHFFRRSS
jgi:hypothetical protein